ncbi:type II toxin-antitoxin system PemK/MazF family toxin [Rhizomicrobium electricum]|uniref:Type II toxin-antitoxin system PemK/MazF family toxin n=1 Tax=Rhizomicrobium electricum TaxID=480070 RepID=A0ABP3NZ42_9PROT|nr:type II toxin-antitoxin system PemK/MazF family toxin [Rhizomicrobium electricum]NIJ47267.1 mRNA interferase MazF [Rhizomicrobium electricum]
MSFDFGDIVLVPFPFTSQTASKKRPAVVVSNRTYNDSKPDIVVMAVTSQLRPAPILGEVWLQDWQGAGLLKPSAIKPVFATLEQGLVIRKLGGLGAADTEALKRAIGVVLG